jgi:serine/threonine protein kinase
MRFRQNALREVYALASLSPSEHIVQYYNAWIEDELLYLQLEYCPQGSLDQIVKKHHQTIKNGTGVSEITLCTIILHTSRALAKLHARGLVHLDVKPSNILLSSDNVFKVGSS